jgi:hypothetical protein
VLVQRISTIRAAPWMARLPTAINARSNPLCCRRCQVARRIFFAGGSDGGMAGVTAAVAHRLVSGSGVVVTDLLRPGGFLYLVEGHPFAGLLDEQTGSVISRDYFDTAPRRETWPYTYTDGDAELAHPAEVEFPHTLGGDPHPRSREPGCGWSSCTSTISNSPESPPRCNAGQTAPGGSRQAGSACQCSTRCAPPAPDRANKRGSCPPGTFSTAGAAPTDRQSRIAAAHPRSAPAPHARVPPAWSRT